MNIATLLRRNRTAETPHFVRDYRLHVRSLFRSHPPDEAAALAVGGARDFDLIGTQEADILAAAGLNASHRLIDLGCGSGRLAKVLSARYPALDYLGTDVVPELLDYAKRHTPATYRFQLHIDLSFPADKDSVDFIASFSVFTHLFHEETFAYLRDAARALKPGGRIVFSYLEFSKHWRVFEAMLSHGWGAHKPHVNMFIEQSAVSIWAGHLGLRIESLDFAPTFGQSVCLLTKT